MELRATLLHDQLKFMGKALFIDTMTGANGLDVAEKITGDMQTLLEAAFNAKGQNSAGSHLSRLVGYLEGMGNTLSSLQAAGVGFYPCKDAEGNSSMRVVLQPEKGAKPGNLPKTIPNLDKLDGPEYEAALEQMTDAERAAHLKND